MTLPDPLGDAARWVASGGLVAYPTETLWALGADASSDEAVARLQRWKQRAADAPVSVLVSDVADAEAHGCELGDVARRLAGAFWPGPLTLVVPAAPVFARGVAREDGALGLRCSPHPLAGTLARRVAREGCGPLTATSLNRSGTQPAATRAQAAAQCGSGPDEPRLLQVPGAEAGGEPATTVIDATREPPRVLRWGGIDAETLSPVVGEWTET